MLLRSPKIAIADDRDIMEIFKYVLDSTGFDISRRMVCDDSHRTLFPTMPGEPISYLPMKICEDSALALYKKLGYGKSYDLAHSISCCFMCGK